MYLDTKSGGPFDQPMIKIQIQTPNFSGGIHSSRTINEMVITVPSSYLDLNEGGLMIFGDREVNSSKDKLRLKIIQGKELRHGFLGPNNLALTEIDLQQDEESPISPDYLPLNAFQPTHFGGFGGNYPPPSIFGTTAAGG